MALLAFLFGGWHVSPVSRKLALYFIWAAYDVDSWKVGMVQQGLSARFFESSRLLRCDAIAICIPRMANRSGEVSR